MGVCFSDSKTESKPVHTVSSTVKTETFHSQNGIEFDNERYSDKIVKCVQCRCGSLVDKITMHYTDETMCEAGANGGGLKEPFELRPGEVITEIERKEGDSLDGFHMKTNQERTSPWFGGKGGGVRPSIVAPEGMCIVGVGRSSGFCPRINKIYLAPIRGVAPTAAEPPKFEEKDV